MALLARDLELGHGGVVVTIHHEPWSSLLVDLYADGYAVCPDDGSSSG